MKVSRCTWSWKPYITWEDLSRFRALAKLIVPVLFLSMLLDGCTTYYSALPIEAWIVDEVTKQPIEGVIVVASWQLEGGLEGWTPLDRMMVMESVTDKDGRFAFTAWGPKPVPDYPWGYSNGRLKDLDPELLIFKDSHNYRRLFNSKTMDQFASSEPTMRQSDWNGKTIKLEPFKGNLKEYAQNVKSFSNHLDRVMTRDVCDDFQCYGSGACQWVHTPKSIIEMARQDEIFESHRRELGTDFTSTVFNSLASNERYFLSRGCPSPKVFLQNIGL